MDVGFKSKKQREGGPAFMISERKYAVAYTSFWRSITPSADSFLRHINLGAARYIAPHCGNEKASTNGVINETAARIARDSWRNGQEFVCDRASGEKLWREVVEWLGEYYFGPVKMTDSAWRDVVRVASGINEFIAAGEFSVVEFDPEFKGCGVVGGCTGDVLADDVLIEIKAGGRSFRTTDLRQLFIYFALARQAGDIRIKRLCLLNPRWGVAWTGTIDEAAIGCGALSAADLSEDIIRGTALVGVSN